MNYFNKLNEEVFFHSFSSEVLQLLADGNKGAWLFKNLEEYFWASDFDFPIDILEEYVYIRQQMSTKSLFISYRKNKFRAKLIYKERIGGYKEPLQEMCFASASGHSVLEALSLLNKKLVNIEKENGLVELTEHPIIFFSKEKTAQKLELVKNNK